VKPFGKAENKATRVFGKVENKATRALKYHIMSKNLDYPCSIRLCYEF